MLLWWVWLMLFDGDWKLRYLPSYLYIFSRSPQIVSTAERSTDFREIWWSWWWWRWMLLVLSHAFVMDCNQKDAECNACIVCFCKRRTDVDVFESDSRRHTISPPDFIIIRVSFTRTDVFKKKRKNVNVSRSQMLSAPGPVPEQKHILIFICLHILFRSDLRLVRDCDLRFGVLSKTYYVE